MRQLRMNPAGMVEGAGRWGVISALVIMGGIVCLVSGCDGDSSASATPSPQPARRSRPAAKKAAPAKTTIAEMNRLLADVRQNRPVTVPASAKIRGIRARRQLNDYLCVIACTEMLFRHLGLNRGNQYQIGREYAQANPTSPGRKTIAGLRDGQLRSADWSKIETNYNGLKRYFDTKLGNLGKCYYWEYAGTGSPARTFKALQVLVSHNVPVLVSVKGAGRSIGHSVLMVGYTPGTVVVIDPISGRRINSPREKFMRMFKRINCEWMTFVTE